MLDKPDFVRHINKLWASLARHDTKDTGGQDNHSCSLIALDCLRPTKQIKSGDQEPLKKTGRHRKAKRVGKFKFKKMKKIMTTSFLCLTIFTTYSQLEVATIDSYSNEISFFAPKTTNNHLQCQRYYITWIGVVDNGEGDDWPHGPHGNLHLQLYNCNGQEISHTEIQGPSWSGEKWEFLDGDHSNYCIYIGDYSCIYYVKIWESDPNKYKGFNFGKLGIKPRSHDILYNGVPNQDGIWYSGRAAKSDARQNALRRGANSWVRDVWNGGIQSGIPSMFIRVSCSCN